MKTPPFLTAIALALFTGNLAAQPVEILSYESIPSRIASGNPTLAAARFRIDEAVGRMNQSGRLPNPSLDTSASHNLRSAEGSIEIGLSQKFPLTNRLILERRIGAAEVEAASAEVRDVARLLAGEARMEFVKIASIRERLSLLERQENLSNELVGFISSASERGEISALDAARAKLAALRIATEERRLRAEETEALGKLRPLLGIDPAAGVSLSGNIPPVSVPPPAGLDRPDLRAADIAARAALTGIALEEAKRRDDMEASVFAAGERTEDAPDGLENEAIIGFKLSFPLPFWNDNQGNIDEAKARHSRKQQEVRALALEIGHESQTALSAMREWAALVSDLDNRLLPLAKEQTGLLEDAYRKGQGELQSVLSSREQTLELLASRIDATLEFRLARIRYQTARGGSQ